MEKARILVVEDEESIAKLVKKVIEMDDFVVDLAHDGKSGLKEAINGNYDLIVLDIMLPELNGLEVCKELRIRNVKTPIIMLTARDTIADRLTAADAGADDYLSKPFAFEVLLERINTLLKYEAKKISGDFLGKGKNGYGQDRRKGDSKMAEFYQRILDNVPVSIVTIDKDGEMTSANKYYHTFSKNNFKYNNIFTGKFFVRENLVNDYKKLLTEGTIVRRDYCYERNGLGEDKYLKIIAVPLLNKEGGIDGALSMALDNTESVLFRKKLQVLNNELEEKVAKRTAQLNEANNEIAKVLELKSIFVADVSHEMRTSLAIIQGNIELISRGLVEESEIGEMRGQMLSEVKRMTNMLSDMTMLSDAKASRQKLDFEKIDISQLICEVCKSLQVVARERNIKIKQKNVKQKVEITADKAQMEKMLLNLVRNAIRYNKDNGSIKIWTDRKENVVSLHVQDTGVGIEKRHLQNIFERFYRVDKARSRSEGGSGLGLAICKWVAEIHGGKIEVESNLGTGSLFSVKLPQNFEAIINDIDNVEK